MCGKCNPGKLVQDGKGESIGDTFFYSPPVYEVAHQYPVDTRVKVKEVDSPHPFEEVPYQGAKGTIVGQITDGPYPQYWVRIDESDLDFDPNDPEFDDPNEQTTFFYSECELEKLED
jgi:hypothetical protein